MRYRFLLPLLVFPLWLSAESLTATVTAYDKVTLSGDVPDGVSVDYMQYQSTHYKCRLSAGDSAVLNIHGLPYGRITGVTLSMKSNKSAGAGSLRMQVGDEEAWVIADAAFADEAWNGAYTTTYTDIVKNFDDLVITDDIRLVIASSVNSLYIESVKIYFTVSDELPSTVYFETYTGAQVRPRRERIPGEGVVLPDLDDPSETWHFVGWRESYTSKTDTRPDCIHADSLYVPPADITLHALYTTGDITTEGLPQQTGMQSGEYAFVFPYYSVMMAGWNVRSDHKLFVRPCVIEQHDNKYYLAAESVPEACRYAVDFTSDSLFIRHSATGLYIGHNNSNQLSNDSTPWAWFVTENNGLYIHYDFDSQTNTGNGLSVRWGTYMADADSINVKVTPLVYDEAASFMLFHVEAGERPAVWFASEPSSDALQDIRAAETDWSLPVTVYTCDGRVLTTGVISGPDALPRGIWVIRQGRAVMKVAKY